MPTFKTSLLAIVATVCFVSTAAAQTHTSGAYGSLGPSYAHHTYAHPWRGYWGFRRGYPHSWADVLHGQADVIRSRGLANLLNAQAWTQAEEARSRDLANDVLELNTYYERRRINTQERFGHLHALAQSRKAERAEYVKVSLQNGIDPSKPARLTPQELDPATGQLRWPMLLQTKHFDRARGPVDTLFARRAKFGNIHPDHYIPFRNWIEKVKAELHRNVNSLPKEDYAVAQDFLRRLITEARSPAGRLPAGTQLASITK